MPRRPLHSQFLSGRVTQEDLEEAHSRTALPIDSKNSVTRDEKKTSQEIRVFFYLYYVVCMLEDLPPVREVSLESCQASTMKENVPCGRRTETRR